MGRTKTRRAQLRRLSYRNRPDWECLRCRWKWRGYAKRKPVACPNCASRRWDTPYRTTTYRGRPHCLAGKQGAKVADATRKTLHAAAPATPPRQGTEAQTGSGLAELLIAYDKREDEQ